MKAFVIVLALGLASLSVETWWPKCPRCVIVRSEK
jgi:hypothetical protein